MRSFEMWWHAKEWDVIEVAPQERRPTLLKQKRPSGIPERARAGIYFFGD
jgi:hypothetical protein